MDEPLSEIDGAGLDSQRVTRILNDIRGGDASAMDRLMREVYPELQRMARGAFGRQQSGHTLQPTALVHEACLKLVKSMASIEDRVHLFRVAGRAMRQILTDHARAKFSSKRGGDVQRLTLSMDPAAVEGADVADVLALDEALQSLEALNERHSAVVELRVFSGLSIEETAEALGVSMRTVDSDWAMAKAWLRRRLSGEQA